MKIWKNQQNESTNSVQIANGMIFKTNNIHFRFQFHSLDEMIQSEIFL